MNGSQEGRGVFGVASGDAAPAFEVKHGIFHEVTQLVDVLVVRTLHEAILFGRDDGSHAWRAA